MFHKDFFSSPSSQGLALGLLVRGFRLGLFRYTKSPRLGLPRAHRQPVQCLPRGVITRVLPFSGLLSVVGGGVPGTAFSLTRFFFGVLGIAGSCSAKSCRSSTQKYSVSRVSSTYSDFGCWQNVFFAPLSALKITPLPSRTLPSLLPSASFQDLLSALHCVVTDSKLSLQIQQVILPLGCAEYAPKSTPRYAGVVLHVMPRWYRQLWHTGSPGLAFLSNFKGSLCRFRKFCRRARLSSSVISLFVNLA